MPAKKKTETPQERYGARIEAARKRLAKLAEGSDPAQKRLALKKLKRAQRGLKRLTSPAGKAAPEKKPE